jgi:LacI family transcriptional regulator
VTSVRRATSDPGAACDNKAVGAEKPDAPVTIKTIARVAGVHPSTVSRALSPHRKARIREDTVRRIKELADSLGYEPNPWARSLRTRRSLTIGLVLPRLTDFLAQMFEGAEDRAREHGYQPVAASTRDDQAEERRVITAMLERRVDGLIIATSSAASPFLDELAGRHVPFQLLNRTSGNHPAVSVDDELGGYWATKHLLGRGHRRVGLVGGPRRFSSAAMRLRGFERAHAEAGLAVDPALIMESGFDSVSGASAASVLLALPDPPTAVFAVNDSVAIGVVAAARDLGLRIPDSLAVIGFNDNEISQMLAVPLSSVAIPLAKMGSLAVDLLVEQIQGQPGRSAVLLPKLVARASSARTVEAVPARS